MKNKIYALYAQTAISPRDKYRYKLLQDFVYDELRIPAGFKTDGASVPRIFWFIFPPNSSSYMPAVIIHDYLCEQAFLKYQENQTAGRIAFRAANNTFKKVLVELEIKKWKISLMLFGISCYMFLKYGVTK